MDIVDASKEKIRIHP